MKMRMMLSRLRELVGMTVDRGSHRKGFYDGHCAMELVAYVNGTDHTDLPSCSSAYLTDVMIGWNDRMASTNVRTAMIRPLIPLVIGTRTGQDDDMTRKYMAVDWLCRVALPPFLRLAGRSMEAQIMAASEVITDRRSLVRAMQTLRSVYAAPREIVFAIPESTRILQETGIESVLSAALPDNGYMSNHRSVDILGRSFFYLAKDIVDRCDPQAINDMINCLRPAMQGLIAEMSDVGCVPLELVDA